jgi:hypothetical protein
MNFDDATRNNFFPVVGSLAMWLTSKLFYVSEQSFLCKFDGITNKFCDTIRSLFTSL